MKAYFLILAALFLSSKISGVSGYSDKYFCDSDHKYDSDFKAIKIRPDKEKPLYEYYVKGGCKGKEEMGSSTNNDEEQYYCYDYSKITDTIEKPYEKAARKQGKSCKYDADCLSGYLCKNNKCSDKCDNKCEKNQECYDDKCRDKYLKTGADCKERSGDCAPGLTCYKDKCTKLFSLEDGKESDSSSLCQSNDAFGGKCHSVKSVEGSCTDTKITVTYDDDTKDEYKSSSACFKHEVTETKVMHGYLTPGYYKFFKDKIAKKFDKLDSDKLAEKDWKDVKEKYVNSYGGYQKIAKDYVVYDYWDKLRVNDIIDEEGKTQDGKNNCLNFIKSQESSSTLKISLALALFALLL